MRYFDVYVDGLKDLYTYSDKNDEFELGENVIVSFRNTKKSAFIIKENKNKNFNFNVLNIENKVKSSIKLNEEQLNLIEWLVEYYILTYDSAVNLILPKNIKIKYNENYYLNFKKIKDEKYLEDEIVKFIFQKIALSYSTLKNKFRKSVIDNLIKLKFFVSDLKDKKLYVNIFKFKELEKEYKDIFLYFNNRLEIKKDDLDKKFEKKAIKDLIELGVLESNLSISKKKEIFLETLNKVQEKESILNEEQLKVKLEIENSTEKLYLLKGITGSGKTEVYIELIKKAFFKGEGSIFLVPEISLTPQMISRFRNEFQNNIAILHSSLTDTEKAKEWESLYKGEKKIVLGVRSAIFSPVHNLKYIILDEEHETTYKQDNNPRYNAKYVAIKRCLIENSKLILGSASPSIESYYYAKKGIYKPLNLYNRFGNAKIPKIEIVDMKQEEDIFFSKKLLNEIKKTLINKEQVILLLNRKGYSTYIQCKDCGHVEECHNCSIKMNYFKGTDTLKCNYCGKIKKFTHTCSKCGSKNLIHSGKGIERVEEEIKKYFSVPIIKVDGDYSKNKNFFNEMYQDFLNKKYSILIGTQIIAKGLHFPDVTLVGVINSDLILNFPDFRAGEKTFQLLTQVSGRAGRGEKEGKVIIQTYQNESYVIKNSKEELYEKFFENEIEKRKMFSYPPFTKLINIGISSENEEEVLKFSREIFNDINDENVEIYGPMPSMVYKVKKRYRMNIFIKGNKKNIESYKVFLRKNIEKYTNKNVRIAIDIDPINLL